MLLPLQPSFLYCVMTGSMVGIENRGDADQLLSYLGLRFPSSITKLALP